MVFSSLVFLWIFLPVTFLGSVLIRKTKYQNIFLLAASLLFYAWGEPSYIFLLLASVLLNWWFGLRIDAAAQRGDADRKKLFLILDIAANLGFLGYFKYTNFVLRTAAKIVTGIVTLTRGAQAAAELQFPVTSIALPIGISFFTFQAMSYVIDLYRGKYKVQKSLLNLALYISFFPQLIAGPIVQYKDIDAQITERSVTLEKLGSGLRRFLYGLGKKVILANLLASAADKIYALEITEMTGLMAWAGAVFYTLQIYYDFSGYSDMAIGLGRMFGFEFLENFNYPYISSSIQEFWRRWHISLSSWFRDYLYIPLGGNRKGKKRTYLNLFIVFFLTGLWHGASWNFVGWGLYHGFFLIIERMGFKKLLEKNKVLSHIYTILVFVIGWVFFRVESVRLGFAIVFRMLMPWTLTQVRAGLGTMISVHTVIAMILGILGCGLFQTVMSKGKLAGISSKWKNSPAEAVYLTAVLFYSILLLANNTYNPFIYFRF